MKKIFKLSIATLFLLNLVYFLPNKSIENETFEYAGISKSIKKQAVKRPYNYNKIFKSINKKEYNHADIIKIMKKRAIKKPYEYANSSKSIETQASKQPYEYIIVPDKSLCYKQNNFLTAMIITRVDDFQVRDKIRNTWASDKFSKLKKFFIVGTQAVEGLNQLIKNESDIHHDILQADFIDSYRNLTIKTMVGIRYIEENCNTKFVLKIDDDVIANTPKLINYLSNQLTENENQQNMFYCEPLYNTKVIRDTDNKWHLTKKEFKNDNFPNYCAGTAYIFTGDLPKKLCQTTNYVKFIQLEDVYVGLLAAKLNSKLINISKSYLYNWYSTAQTGKDLNYKFKLDNMFFISTHEEIPIWDYLNSDYLIE